MVASAARCLICRNCGTEGAAARPARLLPVLRPTRGGYDADALARVTREQIEAGPTNMWRYAPLLPVGQDPASRVTLDPGLTPLVRADALAERARPARPAVGQGRLGQPHPLVQGPGRLGRADRRARASASPGSPAPPPATWPTRWPRTPPGPACRPWSSSRPIWRPARYSPPRSTAATWSRSTGSYDDVNRLCSELTETDEFEKTAFVNVNLRPFYAEGSKTLGYEVAEQLGWRLPEQIVIPMASGELLTKVDKAFAELVEIGLVEPPANGWKVFGAQSAGCNPIAAALHAGVDEITPVKPTGIAKSLNIGDPASGLYALEAVRRTGGWMDVRRRRRDPRRHPPAGPDHRRLRRDGRWRHRRGGPASWSRPAGSIPTPRRSSSTPVKDSRRSMPSRARSVRRIGFARRCAPRARPT